MRTSETENSRKEQILGRMPHNLPTIKRLMAQNVADFQRSQTSGSKKERREAAERLKLRRRKLATLCEELSLRTHRLQPIMKRMEQVCMAIRIPPGKIVI